MRYALLPVVLLLVASPSWASLVVPDSFPTIGAALAAAAPGDTVLVRAGTYPERVSLVDAVVLRGESLDDRPVVDGGAGGAVVTAVGCGPGTKVEGLVLTNGAGGALGGGASLSASDVAFTDCRFTANAAANGAGLGADGGNFTVSRCRFDGNVAMQSGGGLAVTGIASPTIDACRFDGNSAVAGGALAILNGSTPTITGSVLDANSASQGSGAWWDFLTGGTLSGCSVVAGPSSSPGEGALHFSTLSTPTITACIVAFSPSGMGVFVGPGAAPTFGCCDIFGNAGGDAIGGIDLGTNLSVDPLFCDSTSHNWTLHGTSPCLPDLTCPLRGALGAGCFAVAAGESVANLSWGRVKSLWRR